MAVDLDDVGDDLALLLERLCGDDHATKVAKDIGFEIGTWFGTKKKKYRVRSELAMIISAIVIGAINEVYDTRNAKIIIDEFLSKSRTYVFREMEIVNKLFEREYPVRLEKYFSALKTEKPLLGLSFNFLGFLGLNAIGNLKAQIDLSKFLGSIRGEVLKILSSGEGQNVAEKNESKRQLGLLGEFEDEISDWPAEQARIALELILAITSGDEERFESLYPKLTYSQFQAVSAHIEKLEAATSPDGSEDEDEGEDEILFYRVVEGLVSQFGFYEKLLTAQGTDEEFCIASLKFQKAGFLAEQSEKVVAALIIDAVKKYEENRQEAVFFLEALEKNISSHPPQRSHAETRDGEGKKFDSYHEALDVVVERLEPFVSLLARPEQEREITIVSEFLGYAASYHAKKMMGVELSQVGWNSFASSVEYRIVAKLGENPKRSGANILPGGGVEFVSYSTQYRSYLTKIDNVVDESFTPAKANVWPVLDGLGVGSRRLSETQAKDLEKNFNWCVGLCMREVVPDVVSSFG